MTRDVPPPPYAKLDSEQRLFLSFARTHQVARARAECEADAELAEYFDLPDFYSRVESLDRLEAERFNSLLLDAPKAERRCLFYWYIFRRQRRIEFGDLTELEENLSAWFLSPGSPERLLLLFMRAHVIYREGRTHEAIRVLREHVFRPATIGLVEPRQDFALATAASGLGYLQLQVADFAPAHAHLTTALEISMRAGFQASELRDGERLGELYWATGQYELALRYHSDPDRRAMARELSLWDWMALSHNCATKIAIDAGDLDRAHQEAAATAEIIESQDVTELQRHFATLFEAEILSFEGEYEAARQRAEAALRSLSSLKPPSARVIRDGRLVVAEMTLRAEGVSADYLRLLDELIDDAVARGTVGTQFRTHLLRALLTVVGRHETVDVRAVYGDLDERHRAELLNWPEFLLGAVRYLFQRSENPRTPQQKEQLLRRLEGLRPAVERSCHPGLYALHTENALRKSGLGETLLQSDSVDHAF